MKVPYINLVLQHKALKKDILNAIERVLDQGMFILGEEVSTFEKNIAEYCDVKYAIGVNSGTDALYLSLKALNIGKGDEVITVPNSFIATTTSIVNCGAKPIFVDVKQDMNINPELIKNAITDKTKAVLPVHLTGKPCDLDLIKEICMENDMYLIEDAAQAIGAKYNDKKVGSFGDVNAFSLHPLKNLNACGDGGIITTNDYELYEKLKILRNIGLKNRDEVEFWGINSRLDTIQAAILNVKLKYLNKWIEKRRKIANYYDSNFENLFYVPKEEKNIYSVYHTYIIQTKKRDELKKFLIESGIDTKIHYPIPIPMQKISKHSQISTIDFPIAYMQKDMILSLPIYPELTKDQIDYVIEKVSGFFK